MMKNARSSVMTSMLALSLAAIGCDAAAPEVEVTSAALTGPTAIAYEPPSGLIESTGNLYWTNSGYNRFTRMNYGQVYRTGKGSAPGSETVLYSQTSFGYVHFGDITFASVGGVWYGYFTADYGGSWEIKRVPLAGGTATTFVTASSSVGRTLVNDGTYLYWADSTGLHETSLSSGTTWTMAAIAGINSVAQDSWYVYFSTPTQINRVLKSNWGLYTVYSGGQAISGITVQQGATSADTTVYWADGRNVFAIYHGSTTFWGGPPIGNVITSLSWDGISRLLWTQCSTTNTSCSAQYRYNPYGGGGVNVGDYANFIQGDSGAMFYGTNGGVFRVNY